jgi:hypothetical protein
MAAKGQNKSYKERQEQAKRARERMAKRSKRARWWKEQKKHVLMIVGGIVLIFGLMVFTPFGPDWYYNRIQNSKLAGPGQMTQGTIKRLYNLGVFYSYSFRSSEAVKIYDEVATYFYGFTFSEFAMNPLAAMDKRYAAEDLIAENASVGPPYSITGEDLKYVGLCLAEAGFLAQDSGRSRILAANLFNELYMGDFYAEHPEACDPETTELVKAAGDRLAGRR